MRRKSVLQLGVALLSVSFAMTAMNGNTVGVAFAAFESEEESTDIAVSEITENVEQQTVAESSETFTTQEMTTTSAEQTIVETTNIPETAESEGTVEAEENTEGTTTPLEEMVEITLPKESVYVPISALLPVEEEEKIAVLNSYNGYYVLHIKNDSEVQDVLYFNQKLKLSDIALYSFDSEKNTITNSKPVEDVMSLDEEKSILTLDLETDSDYVLVISNQLNDTDFGYTSKFMPLPSENADNESETLEEAALLMEEDGILVETVALEENDQQVETIVSLTESETSIVTNAFVEETVPEELPEETAEVEETSIPSTEESITAAETTTDMPNEEAPTEESIETTEEDASSAEEIIESSIEETSEEIMELESESETESSSEEEVLELVSVKLKLDQNLDTVPIAFLDYLDSSDVYSLVLTYSDGSERLFNKEDERYAVSVDYEDINDTEGILYRTYHITVKENSTGKIFEDSQSVEFGRKDLIDIKTEEMTTVIVKGSKWVMVQSTPSITGRYSMNSDKIIESMYYSCNDDDIICADDIFRLQQGVTYKFLIKLK